MSGLKSGPISETTERQTQILFEDDNKKSKGNNKN